MPSDRRRAAPLVPEHVSHRTSTGPAPTRSRRWRRNPAALPGAVGSAPAARASAATPSVPLSPTRPPIPAIGFTTNPTPRTPAGTARPYFGLPRSVPPRRVPRSRSAPGAGEACGRRDGEQVRGVSRAGDRQERPERRCDEGRRHETRGEPELDDPEFVPGDGHQVPRPDAAVDGRGSARARRTARDPGRDAG